MRYGSERITTTLDAEGSTLTVETKYKEHQVMPPIRKEYQIRIKVKDKKQELEEYLRFSDETKDKIDPQFKIEHSAIGNQQGFYYVVKVYTVLER